MLSRQPQKQRGAGGVPGGAVGSNRVDDPVLRPTWRQGNDNWAAGAKVTSLTPPVPSQEAISPKGASMY